MHRTRTTGLADDVATALAPIRAVADRLSMADRFMVEKTCDAVVAMCADEEEQARVTVDLLNEAQDELEDR